MGFFRVEHPLEVGGVIGIKGHEAQHILQARRIRIADTLTLQDPIGNRFEAKVVDASRRELQVSIQKVVEPPSESPLMIEVVQALPKEKALDFILQKGTELGVSKLSFVASQYSPKRPNTAQQSSLMERWGKIAWEACKQSGRHHPPEIQYQDSLQTISPLSEQTSWVLSCDEGISVTPLTPQELIMQPQTHYQIWVGPEGGWSTDELQWFAMQQMRFMGLGPRVLRAETAALNIIALLQACAGDGLRGF